MDAGGQLVTCLLCQIIVTVLTRRLPSKENGIYMYAGLKLRLHNIFPFICCGYHKNRLNEKYDKNMGKKIFTLYTEKFCLSKHMYMQFLR